jgi:3-phenylpropionate/trans-cinnamate dioxygenase ferredoxin subunit
MSRYSIGKVEDFAVGELTRLEVAGKALCIAHVDSGDIFAMNDLCTHEEESLSEGFLDGDAVECPAHGSRFCLRTGAVSGLPATEDNKVYPITSEGDDLFVEIE